MEIVASPLKISRYATVYDYKVMRPACLLVSNKVARDRK